MTTPTPDESFVAFVHGVREIDPNVGAWEIADALFLAHRLRVEQPTSEQSASTSPAVDSQQAPTADAERAPSESSQGQSSTAGDAAAGPGSSGPNPATVPTLQPGLYADVTAVTGQRARRVRTPGGRALLDPLGVMRALRPLMRRVGSRTDFVLDVDATVEHAARARMARLRSWSPVLRPRPERWLTIDLIVDTARSMRPWQDTVAEFRRTLERSGGFRSIRVWRWDPRAQPGLSRDGVTVARLPSTSGTRLVLVVTNCLDAVWRDGRATRQIARWGHDSSTAIVQVLPEHLWNRTALADMPLANVQQSAFGGSNRQLQWSVPEAPADLLAELLALSEEHPIQGEPDEEESAPAQLAVPLVTFDASRLQPWARMVAGRAAPGVRAVLMAAPSLTTQTIAAEPDAMSWLGIDRHEPGSSDARRLVEVFRGYASPGGRRLATCLTGVAPITLSIMRVVRDALVPAPSEAQVAEVLMSGFLQELPGDGPDPAFVWTPGVHELLSLGLTASDFAAVTGAVTRWIGARIGSTREMSSLMLDAAGAERMLITKDTQPFAFLYADNLRRLGHTAEAERLAARAELHRQTTSPRGLDLQRTLTGHRGVIFRMAWSPDGRWLLTPSVDGTIRIWETATGQLTDTLKISGEGINQVTWLGATRFAAACHDGFVRMWELLPNGHASTTDSIGPLHTDVRSAAASPDGSRVAIACDNGIARVYDTSTKANYDIGRQSGVAVPVVVWAENRTVIAGTADGWIFEVRGLTPAPTTPRPHEWFSQPRIDIGEQTPSAILALAVSTRGAIACGDDDGGVFVWIDGIEPPVRRLQRPGAPHAHDDTVTALAFSPDGLVLASKAMDGCVRFWRTDTWELLDELKEPNGNFVLTGLAWHPTLPLLATLGDKDRSVRVWHVDIERLLPIPVALSQVPRTAPPKPTLAYLGNLPYWELAFDEEGEVVDSRSNRHVAAERAAALLQQALDAAGITDLLVIVHGWNRDRPAARHLYNEIATAASDVLPKHDGARAQRLGILGVFWPSKAFADDEAQTIPEGGNAVSDDEAVDALRDAAGIEATGLFERFWTGLKDATLGGLRATSYYMMRGRAGDIGRTGLGPFLARLHGNRQLHLVGHSIGARLTMYALSTLRASRSSARVGSLVLLQPALAHQAFASDPDQPDSPLALSFSTWRFDGPVVVTHAASDNVARAFELAARAAGDPDTKTSAVKMMGQVGAVDLPTVTQALLEVGEPYHLAPDRVTNVDAGRVLANHNEPVVPQIAWLIVSAVLQNREFTRTGPTVAS